MYQTLFSCKRVEAIRGNAIGLLRWAGVAASCVALACSVAACSGPSIAVPPTPTRNAAAPAITQNHVHGDSTGTEARLITRYGGPIGVAVTEQPPSPQPSSPFTITYTLKDGAGSPVGPDGLALTHDRLMHLIVVSQDLTFFNHIHPLAAGQGSYSTEATVPASGKYLLFNEFVTAQGVTQIERDLFNTGATAPDTQAVLTLDFGTTQQIDGLSVKMTSPSPKLRRRLAITFVLDVSKDGKPVTDLEPYLAAPCHVVIISADTKQFTHTHGDVPGGPMSGDMSNMDMSKMGNMPVPAHFGPKIQFTHTFMQPGIYRIWMQFGYMGKVETVAYNVSVEK